MTVTTSEPDAAEAVPAPPALEVTDLSSGYGDTAVLRGVSLTVPAGAVTALLGPNGAGKTTFLRTVSGLVPATSGSIKMGGTDITRTRVDRRFTAGLCHVPEGRGVFRGLTVRDNIVMQAVKGEETRAIERATEAFPILGERLHQRAGTMSGGQQQMLAMAAAYVRDPKLVLVDEASLGLAPTIVDEIFAFLERRTLEGASLLIVDQFVHRALQMATTAFVLNRGSIAFEGGAEDLLNSNLFEQYLGQGAA
jgi:branched-chain amino acid transport system ATP-binding protein